MDTTLTHTRDPLAGWDISTVTKAGKGETITAAKISVNGFPEYDETFDQPLNQWQHQLTQKGVYPGDNKVLLEITDGNGQIVRTQDSW
jgi:hypothetical protein